MRQSITQEFDYGCAIACFAFSLSISYKQATDLLGEAQSSSNRFWVKDLEQALNENGLQYKRCCVKDLVLEADKKLPNNRGKITSANP